MAHCSEEVAAPNFLEVGFGVAHFQEAHRDEDEVVVGVEPGHSTASVEVGSDAHMVDTRHFHHIVEVANKVVEGGFAISFEEAAVRCSVAWNAEVSPSAGFPTISLKRLSPPPSVSFYKVSKAWVNGSLLGRSCRPKFFGGRLRCSPFPRGAS